MPYKDKSKKLASTAKWRKTHKAQVKSYNAAYTKRWREERPEHYRARQKEKRRRERELHPDKKRIEFQRLMSEHPRRYILNGARARSKSIGHDFNIEEDDIVIPEKCPILDIPLVHNVGTKAPSCNSPSLDRIDPTKGYISGNVWVISHRANLIKLDASLEELEKIVAALQNVDAILSSIVPGYVIPPQSCPNEDRHARNRRMYPDKQLLVQARFRAKKNGIPFDITRSDIVIPVICPLLGIPIFKLRSTGKPVGCPNSPSLDRIDPTKGYVKGNIWVVSYRANRIKNNATVGEFEKVVHAMRKRLQVI